MGKFKIRREFFPFSHFTPPISGKFLAMAVPHMKTPKFIYKDKELRVKRYEINLDFVIRIREYPRNKKGKKKSVVLD